MEIIINQSLNNYSCLKHLNFNKNKKVFNYRATESGLSTETEIEAEK